MRKYLRFMLFAATLLCDQVVARFVEGFESGNLTGGSTFERNLQQLAIGDGVVNQTDILAIELNRGNGRTLLKGEPEVEVVEKIAASLSMNVSQATPAPNTSFTFNVMVSEIVDLFGQSALAQ